MRGRTGFWGEQRTQSEVGEWPGPARHSVARSGQAQLGLRWIHQRRTVGNEKSEREITARSRVLLVHAVTLEAPQRAELIGDQR